MWDMYGGCLMSKRHIHQCDNCKKIVDSNGRIFGKQTYYSAPKEWLVILGYDACSKVCAKAIIDKEGGDCPTCGE